MLSYHRTLYRVLHGVLTYDSGMQLIIQPVNTDKMRLHG